MNQDLTTGKPGAVLRKFCLPLFGSIIFQQLYNIADSFVAGKFIDNNALAAVGNGYEITLIFIAFAFGCNIGCSVLVSQLFGARQHRDMKTAVHTTLIASGVLCAVLMLVGFLCTDSLLRLIQTPEEILEDSKLYLNIYISFVLGEDGYELTAICRRFPSAVPLLYHSFIGNARLFSRGWEDCLPGKGSARLFSRKRGGSPGGAVAGQAARAKAPGTA